MSATTEYKPELVRDKIVGVFKKRKGEATTADLVALTGLPKSQVEAEVPAVADEYGARLRVTESGEILYSFPSGVKSRYRGFLPSLKRFWKSFKKGAAVAASFVFKIWIVVMLVGYFVLFVALVLLALLASVAVSVGGGKDSRDRHGDGGLGGLYLASRLFDTFIQLWFYSEIFKSPNQRDYEYRNRMERKREKRPLHKAIFSFVFGDGDPNADWDTVEKKAVVAWLQANKGIITIHEFMFLTGLSPIEAEARINRYLFEFEGEPRVSDEGTIYYAFPSLLRRKDKVDRTWGGSLPMKRLSAFSANPKKMNRWFCAINGFNLVFGTYFLQGALTLPTANIVKALQLMDAKLPVPTGLIPGFDTFYAFVNTLFMNFVNGDPATFLAIGLGVVPLVFSVLFYAIPAIRKARLDRSNEGVKVENLRRIAYRAITDRPEGVRPEAIGLQAAASSAACPKDSRAAEKVVVEFAAAAQGEPASDGSYNFPEVRRSQDEALKARAAVREEDFDLGATVFDSHS